MRYYKCTYCIYKINQCFNDINKKNCTFTYT